jgi:hypothetical protein
MTLNIKDSDLVKQLIDEVNNKHLCVNRDFVTGEERISYKHYERPKIRFKKLIIGHIAAIKPSGVVECELEHPRGINFMLGKDKSKISVGR